MDTVYNRDKKVENNDYNPQDRSDAVDALAIDPYKLIDDAYFGNGGFRNNTYLIPHPIEGFYINRRGYSCYTNILRPAIDSLVDPIYNRQIKREVDNENSIAAKFINDSSGNGKKLHDLAKRAAKVAARHGIAFVVMDNYPAESMPQEKRIAVENRIFPYAFIRTALDIEYYKVDRFGNLKTICFIDMPESKIVEPGKPPVVEQYYMEYSATTIKKLKKDDKNSKLVEVKTYDNPIGIIPITIVMFDDVEGCNFLPFPKMDGPARKVHEIFNLESEQRELMRKAIFSFLAIQSDRGLAGVSLGKGNLLTYPESAQNPPMFIVDEVESIRVYGEVIDKKYNQFYALMDQLGVIISPVKEESGVSKEWDFLAHEEKIASVAEIMEGVERKIIKMLDMFTGEATEYYAAYPKQFNPGADAKRVKMYDNLLMQDLPPMARGYTLAELFRVAHGAKDAEEVQQYIEEIRSQSTDEMNSEINDGSR